MKTSSIAIVPVAWLALVCPLAAQLPDPPSREVTPSPNNTAMVPDGIVVYRGQTYLIRNGRAALVDETLVPDGQLLSQDGHLVPVPSNYIAATTNTIRIRDGILRFGGHSYLIRRGIATPINKALVPDGQVLTDTGGLAPLPADFSGFNLERTPAGTILPQPVSTEPGQQALPAQAGVPQVPSGVSVPTRSGTTSNANGAGVNAGGQTSVSGGGGSNAGATGVNVNNGVINGIGGTGRRSGVRTTPGTTAANITHGSTRAGTGIPAGSTAAKVVGGLTPPTSGTTFATPAGGTTATANGGGR